MMGNQTSGRWEEERKEDFDFDLLVEHPAVRAIWALLQLSAVMSIFIIVACMGLILCS